MLGKKKFISDFIEVISYSFLIQKQDSEGNIFKDFGSMMSKFPSRHHDSQNVLKCACFIKGLSKQLINLYQLIAWINSFSLVIHEFPRLIIYLIYIQLNFTKCLSHIWSFESSLLELSPSPPSAFPNFSQVIQLRMGGFSDWLQTIIQEWKTSEHILV